MADGLRSSDFNSIDSQVSLCDQYVDAGGFAISDSGFILCKTYVGLSIKYKHSKSVNHSLYKRISKLEHYIYHLNIVEGNYM